MKLNHYKNKQIKITLEFGTLSFFVKSTLFYFNY